MPSTEQLESERLDLNAKLVGLDGEQRRVFYVAPVGMLAIPAGIFWGPLLAIGVVALTFGIIGVGLYIINGHRFEYQARLREVEGRISSP
ncbi:MAG: hypothetical protein H7Z43_04415 [Clostridia bacterium]|nr:hypothetical protein [Deltaproteobacteria bacterium]